MRSRAAVRQGMRLDQPFQRRHRPDYMLVVISVVLLSLGLIVVYAISPGLSVQKGVGDNYYVAKQLTAILLALPAFFLTSMLPLSVWQKLEKLLILAAILAALAVQLFGEEVNGAARWVQIGGLSFQAVELIKFALLTWLAGFLTQRFKQDSPTGQNQVFKTLLIVLMVISLVVAVFQSDLGSTGVIVAMVGGMGFVAGIPLKKVLVFIGIVTLGTILAITTSAYRRDRFATYLNPERDCQNTGYQACQALSAVGSGGMFGKGINRGVFAYGYLPESANDSIFAIYGEMFGFVGSTILIGLFAALSTRLKSIMERAPSAHTRLLAAGVLAWLSTQTLINIGAMIGLLPLKGITLPFVSYGGTSIIFVTAAIGLAFNISRYTTYGVNSMALNEGGRYDDPAYRWGNRRPHHPTISRRS